MDPRRAAILLEVRPGAPTGEVEAAFRRRARECHPDRGGRPAEFREVLAARTTLRAWGGAPVAASPPPVVVRRRPCWRRPWRFLISAAGRRLRRRPTRPRVS